MDFCFFSAENPLNNYSYTLHCGWFVCKMKACYCQSKIQCTKYRSQAKMDKSTSLFAKKCASW